ncbi:MAG TPA: SDR family NAD(P)-dependent oxidoreductase [Planctomycetota bacterium]|nr:SDR family NAD(P)-dependent oxidoreductase [Planctomycetota bacterium]
MSPRPRTSVDADLDLLRVIEALEAIVDDPGLSASLSREDHIRLMTAAGRLSRPSKIERLKVSRKIRKVRHRRVLEADRAAVEGTGIREARKAEVFAAPVPLLPAPESPAEEIRRPRICYVCKEPYTKLHHFYDGLCPVCADVNYAKRFQTATMPGRTALVTGARVKIGYQAALKLLRAGARVLVSSRFPHDAARRYAAEPDFGDWRARLRIHGLDLRHSPSVEIFARYLNQGETRLDALISNACQTVRRPAGFFQHLLDRETLAWKDLPAGERAILESHYECRGLLDRSTADEAASPKGLALLDTGSMGVGIRDSAALSQIRMTYDDRTCGRETFPEGKLDADLQQVDLRTQNSWRMTLAEVPTPELLEVLLINAVAPFVLAARLKPLMLRAGTREVHIVNVSAMEGIFSRGTKTDKHPHTNMAKAALNMMTRTSAADYARDGIHMNAVDTGWVTDEDPVEHATRKKSEGFEPPLDIVDGAARILDPLFAGLNTGVHASGQFFKDYQPSSW